MKSDTRAKQSAETMNLPQWLQETIAKEAFDAYTVVLAQIQKELAELQARADNHFGNDPDSIHWAHVEDLDNILASLQLANGKAE